MSARRYFDTSVLSFVQYEGAMIDRQTGKVIKTPKEKLRLRPDLAFGRDTNTRITLRAALEDREDLLRRFTQFIRTRYEPLTDEQIQMRLS